MPEYRHPDLDAYEGQTAMREMLSGATCVICLATMLHTIATNVQDFITIIAKGLGVI